MKQAARAVLAALIWAGLCGFAAQADDSDITVKGLWARIALPGVPVGVYGEIHSKNGDTLIGVKTPMAERAEIHGHSHVDGVMSMKRINTIEIPANGQANLAAGETHLMLMEPGLLQEGGEFPLTFIFERAGEVEVMAAVRAFDAATGVHDHHSDDDHAGHSWSGWVHSLWERLWPH